MFRECKKQRKSVFTSGKKQWTHERVDKASDETVNKTYAEYEECELIGKSEKTGVALSKYVISL